MLLSGSVPNCRRCQNYEKNIMSVEFRIVFDRKFKKSCLLNNREAIYSVRIKHAICFWLKRNIKW